MRAPPIGHGVRLRRASASLPRRSRAAIAPDDCSYAAAATTQAPSTALMALQVSCRWSQFPSHLASCATGRVAGHPGLVSDPIRARSSARGGAGTCSILANTDPPVCPVRSNRAGGATSAFLESDRRYLPQADEQRRPRARPRLAVSSLARAIAPTETNGLARQPRRPRLMSGGIGRRFVGGVRHPDTVPGR